MKLLLEMKGFPQRENKHLSVFITILGFECDFALCFQALYCSSDILVVYFH